MPVIERTSFVEAFIFGWSALGDVLRQNAVFYAILLAVDILLTAFTASPKHFSSSGIESIAGIAALGAAARCAVPTFRLTISYVLTILGFYLLFAFVIAAVVSIPVLLALAAHDVTLALFLVLVLPILCWLATKVAATPAFYVLSVEDGSTIFDALRGSWSFSSGETWWRVLGVFLCPSLIVGFLTGLPAMLIFVMWGAERTLEVALVAATLYSVGAIAGVVWTTISVVALASTGVWPPNRLRALIYDRGPKTKLCGTWMWLRGVDLNHRPSGYEPDELPDCSTPRQERLHYDGAGFTPAVGMGAVLGPWMPKATACPAIRSRSAFRKSICTAIWRDAAGCDVRRTGGEKRRAAALPPIASG